MKTLAPNAAQAQPVDAEYRTPPRAHVEGRKSLTACKFVCPRCRSEKWGSAGVVGYCHGERVDDFGGGFTARERCAFQWFRADDWRVFVTAYTETAFESAEAFERFNAHDARGVRR